MESRRSVQSQRMKIAIMQPYLFPYVGYFSLIKNTDHFVFFDTPQYIRKGWINRNRLLGSNGNIVYFTVPVEKSHRETPINQVMISYQEAWKEKWRGQLSVYKKRAPFYKEVMGVVEDTLAGHEIYISELAIKSIVKTCEYLGIAIRCDVYSQLKQEDYQIKAPDEWALYITKTLGYDIYVNPPGGKAFFDGKKYREEQIELQFLTQELKRYDQSRKEFIPGLSIIDVMMFCSPKEISDMMKCFILEGGD